MKRIILFFFVVLLSYSVCAQQENIVEKSTYFLIRHAEKERSNPNEKNPNLTEKGQQRAVKWSNLLADYAIEAVYSTEYNRTLQTAKPTAEKFNLEIKTYHPFKLDFEAFLKETSGKSVLVVGHSNTIPFFVNKLIGEEKYQQMKNNDNSSLFIVTIQDKDITHVAIKTAN